MRGKRRKRGVQREICRWHPTGRVPAFLSRVEKVRVLFGGTTTRPKL